MDRRAGRSAVRCRTAPRARRRARRQQRCFQKTSCHNRDTSPEEPASWKQATDTATTITAGASISGRSTSGFSSSRSRLPQVGNGSPTLKPSNPRLASLRMKTGIEIQNCASRIGRRLGSRWRQNSALRGVRRRAPAAEKSEFAQRPGSGANDARRRGPAEHSKQQEGDGHGRHRRRVQRQQGAHGQQQEQPRQREKQVDSATSPGAPTVRPGTRPPPPIRPATRGEQRGRRRQQQRNRACRRAGAQNDRAPVRRCPAEMRPRAER